VVVTTADALCIALAEDLDADFLTDDHRPAEAPTLPPRLRVLRLPVRPGPGDSPA
jgi:predicted nucleic acid-binding protein